MGVTQLPEALNQPTKPTESSPLSTTSPEVSNAEGSTGASPPALTAAPGVNPDFMSGAADAAETLKMEWQSISGAVDPKKPSLDVQKELFRIRKAYKVETGRDIITDLQGEGAKVNEMGMPLPTPLENEFGATVKGGVEALSKLGPVIDKFDANAYSLGGKLKESVATGADFLNAASPQQKELLANRGTQFKQMQQVMNAYRKMITGQASSEKELVHLEKSLLSQNESPTKVKTALKDLYINMTRDMHVAKQFLESGIMPASKDDKDYSDKFEKAGRAVKADIEEKIKKVKEWNAARGEKIDDIDALRLLREGGK